jgi:hypothetical protein
MPIDRFSIRNFALTGIKKRWICGSDRNSGSDEYVIELKTNLDAGRQSISLICATSNNRFDLMFPFDPQIVGGASQSKDY